MHLVALHLIVGAVLVLHGLIQFAGLQITPRPFGQTIQRAVALAAPEFLLIYLVLLLSSFAIDYFRKYRDREIRTAQLEASLQQAKLSALQAQLNPHFLFNALNAVSALMYRDVEAADAMLARIGELLRLTLAADGSHEIRLSEELELLERYLDIERIRFADRLAITVDVPDADPGGPRPAVRAAAAGGERHPPRRRQAVRGWPGAGERPPGGRSAPAPGRR